MALHLVGLGLHDVKDVTVKGLECIRAADVVYAEFYTAILAGTRHEELEDFLQCRVEALPREGVEAGGRALVEEASTRDVVLLTAGDPLAATTHTELVLRAREAGVKVGVIHAPSILSAAPGLVGLQHYKFGRTPTLVRPEEGWFPTSMFDAVQENHEAGLHTLVLLDIKADEGYFMTASEGLGLLLRLAQERGADWFTPETDVGLIARAGAPEPYVVTGPCGRLMGLDAGPPLHCLVVPGKMQVVEEEAWRSLRNTQTLSAA